MKKTTLFQLLVLICSIIILSTSCEKYEDDESKIKGEVEMTFPTSWDVTKNYSEMIILIGKSPIEGISDDFQENINVVKERAEGHTLESYYNANINALNIINNYQFISSTDTTINGLDSKKLIFTATINNIDFKFMDFIFYKDNYGYVITCTAKESTFNDYKSIFEQIVSTFKII